MAGESCEESACQLNKRPQVIEDYRERIKRKIGAKNLNEVIQIMMTKGCSAVERQRKVDEPRFKTATAGRQTVLMPRHPMV